MKYQNEEGVEIDMRSKCVHHQLHALEAEIIQIKGLINALQQVQSDHSAPICITVAIEERVKHLECIFYEHWETICK